MIYGLNETLEPDMKRYRLPFIISVLAFTACAATPEDASAPATTGLTFIHLNDTYRVGAVEDGTAGGFGRVVTIIREAQQAGRDVRILHGGDFLYPSLESQLWNGQQIVDAFNFMDALAPMYAVAGNHEFDRRTPEHLINAVRSSDFDWLGDNYEFVTDDEVTNTALKTAFTFEYEGKTVGLFAITLHAKDGGNVRDYVPIDPDYVAAAERVIEKFEADGVDLIIGVTHVHMSTDLQIAKLRKDHPTFAFIVGGHEHEPEFSAVTDDSAAVMKGASNARSIWQIDVDFDASDMPKVSGRMLIMNQDVVPDTEYAMLDDKWRGRLLERFPFLTARVGMAAIEFDAREDAMRNSENAWGNFVVDQMRTAFGQPATDFSFINSGTLRIDDTIDAEILFEDIGRTFGFSSFLRHITMTGAEFRQLMEAGYWGEGNSKGYFPQVSGFRVCVDRRLPDYSRIVSMQVPDGDGWSEIDADKEYSVAISDFLYGGGDGYKFPQDRPVSRPGSELKYLVLDGILQAQAQGVGVGVDVDPENPRFVELTDDRKECFE
jgi:2',3'-cyclic-nucleotide 2'-phosphodiesterase (5'-nucleotidase family)